jgi:hypothetical protein
MASFMQEGRRRPLLAFLSPFPCMCVWRVGPKLQLHPNSTRIVYTMHYQPSQMATWSSIP